MEKKEKQSGLQLLPVLLVCMLLACAGILFAVYTHREVSWLRMQILEHEKLIQTLQLRNNVGDIQGSKAVRIQRSAQDGSPGSDEISRPKGIKGDRGAQGIMGQTEFVCQAKADVAFLVDSSWSIGPRNWRKMLQFLKDMVKAFNVGPDKTHIAVVTFSTEAQIEFNFDTQVTKEDYYRRIDRMEYLRGYSYMDKALIRADKEVFTVQAGMRPEFPKIAIVITDGKQTRRGIFTELSVASRGLRLKKVQLYSLGIGKYADLQQLANITGSKDKVFYADSFATLAPVAQAIVQNSCPVHSPTTRSPATLKQTELVCRGVADVAFIVDSSSRIGLRNWNKMLLFLKNMVKAFRVGPDKTRIALVSYSTTAYVVINLNSFRGSEITLVRYLVLLIERLPLYGGLTFIDKGLILADQEVFTEETGMRPGIPKIALVITAGMQTTTRGPYTELSLASRGLKHKKVQIYSLGIGRGVDRQELQDIASSKDKVFYADNFEDLTSMAQTIVQKLCPVLSPPATLPPVTVTEKRATPPASVRASIYLAGDDTSLRKPVSNIISNWIVRHKIGSIQYDRGFIIVTTAGHYFIYSQMYYHDARTHVMAHYTYINNEKVMESIGSAFTNSTNLNTKYHGGVFLLTVNDTISVRIPYMRHYNMKTDASFFGAVLLYPGGPGE